MKTTTTRKYREDFDNVKQAFEAAIDLFYELNNKKRVKEVTMYISKSWEEKDKLGLSLSLKYANK